MTPAAFILALQAIHHERHRHPRPWCHCSDCKVYDAVHGEIGDAGQFVEAFMSKHYHGIKATPWQGVGCTCSHCQRVALMWEYANSRPVWQQMPLAL